MGSAAAGGTAAGPSGAAALDVGAGAGGQGAEAAPERGQVLESRPDANTVEWLLPCVPPAVTPEGVTREHEDLQRSINNLHGQLSKLGTSGSGVSGVQRERSTEGGCATCAISTCM